MDRRSPPPRAATKGLWPREHGAYAELLLPLGAALVGGAPTWASWSFAVAAVAGFAAHEPLLVLLGHRGPRAARDLGARARRWLAVEAGVALVAGLVALALAPSARLVALAPVPPLFVLAALVAKRREKSLAGETVAAAALSGAALPVAVSAGAPASLALAAWAVWTATFGAWTWVVRGLVARRPALVAPLAVLSVGALAAWGVDVRLLYALVPAGIACVALFALRPTAKHLRRVGWALVAGSLVTTAVLSVVHRTHAAAARVER